MIIAEIGHVTFELANIKDSENLLRIMSEAKLVDWEYFDSDKTYYYKEGAVSLDISLKIGNVLSKDEFDAGKAERKTQASKEQANV